MSDSAQDVRRIDWMESCSCTQLFRAFRIACQPFQILLVLATLIAIGVVGWTMDRWSAGTWVTRHRGVVVNSELIAYAEGGFGDAAMQRYIVDAQKLGHAKIGTQSKTEGVFAALTHYLRHSVNQATDALLAARWLTNANGRPGLFPILAGVPAAAWWMLKYHFWYTLIFGLIGFALFGTGGGAAYRMAAMRATRNESIPVGEAITFARAQFWNFFAGPLLPWVVFAAFGVVLAVGGFIASLPVFDFLAGVVWFLPLLAGLGMALTLIVCLGIWPLIYPAVAVDAADIFDAASRTAGYVFDRRWKTPFYFLVSTAYGAICLLVVKLIAKLTFWLTHAWVGAGMNWRTFTQVDGKSVGKLDALWGTPGAAGQPFWGRFSQDTGSSMANGASHMMEFWTMLCILAVAAFAVSFFCSSTTLIYLLLRRDVDGTDIEEAWLEDDREDLFGGETAAPPAPAAAVTTGETTTSLPVISSSPGPNDAHAH